MSELPEPIPAATLVLMRERTDGPPELLMTERTGQMAFAAGERVHTENSHKYSPEDLDALATETGFACTRRWTDEAGRFSSNLFVAL